MSKAHTKRGWSLGRIIFIVVISWILLGFGVYFLSDTWEQRGTFGDMFGSVNTLISGLAFAGLLYTIHLQREDLKIQRQSFDNQLQEVKNQVENTKKQLDITTYQSSQETLKYLISVKNKQIESMTYAVQERFNGLNVNRTANGQEALRKILDSIKNNADEVKEHQITRYYDIYKSILQFINDTDLSPMHKKLLQDILNIETSDIEISILYQLNSKDQHMMLLMKSNGLLKRKKQNTQ